MHNILSHQFITTCSPAFSPDLAEDYKTKNTNQFLETIRKYENVTELNRSMLVELIDSIYVYQAEGTGKERTQKVEINYRFLCESQCGIA